VLSFVGDIKLNHQEIIKNVISTNNGIAKLYTLITAGVPKENIYKLCSDGFLQRVRQGYYQLADERILPDEQIIASTIPEAIISMESALFHYGYSDFMPRVWSVSVPRNASRRLNTSVPIKVYYVKDDIYDLGKTTITENGVTFTIYDRERTICDMFKHRGKIDNEMFCKAVNAYANDPQKNLKVLSKYAKTLRVYKKVMDIMEVLLNG
jgi:predicted transcriptional regulator of viral defense system